MMATERVFRNRNNNNNKYNKPCLHPPPRVEDMCAREDYDHTTCYYSSVVPIYSHFFYTFFFFFNIDILLIFDIYKSCITYENYCETYNYEKMYQLFDSNRKWWYNIRIQIIEIHKGTRTCTYSVKLFTPNCMYFHFSFLFLRSECAAALRQRCAAADLKKI